MSTKEAKGYVIQHPGTLQWIYGQDAKELEDKYYEGFNPVYSLTYYRDYGIEDKNDTQKVFLLKSGEVVEKNIDKKSILTINGLRYFVDDYGMGCVHWPIVDSPKNAYDRQLQENIIWAKNRIKWAVDHSPKELPELMQIISTNGLSRLSGQLEELRKIKETYET
jgi:hypothetical protein